MSLEIIRKYSIRAKKGLGQNFLVNTGILDEITSSFDISGKNIIEIGPGYGALTEKLLEKKPKSLTLVELDREMIDILNIRIKEGELNIGEIDFNIENIDVLEYEPSPLTPLPLGEGKQEYFVIANIPYYITSPILRHFLYGVKEKPKKMLILMQKDVGEKILGKGKEKSSVLSLFVQKKCFVKEVLFVGKENFIPAPKVESAVLEFELHNLYNDIDDEKFLDFIKKGFKEPRKKLTKNLEKAGYNKKEVLETLKNLGYDENVRGEDLGIKEWCELSKKLEI